MAKLFGDRPVSAIAVVDAPVSQSYARKARIAFLATAGVVGVSTAAVSAVFTNPALAIVLGVVAGVACGLPVAVLVWVWPVLRVLWWWSIEITALALVVMVPTLLARVTHPVLALVVLLVPATAGAAMRPVRRWLAAWSWCVVARHRLRVCFAEFIRAVNRTRAGSFPLILWARPTPAGGRVWVWLRAGLALSDLEGKTDKVAVTCWAGEARVVRTSQRYAALVRVDLTRRDALAAEVASPLAALVAHLRKEEEENKNADAPVSPAVPPVVLDLADIPEPAPEPRGGRR